MFFLDEDYRVSPMKMLWSWCERDSGHLAWPIMPICMFLHFKNLTFVDHVHVL